MTLLAIAVQVLAVLSAAHACGDGDGHAGHTHVHRRRASPPSRITPPSRPLEWGDINVIHTTDTHGWLLGHQKASSPEPNYSGDFGDFSSFVTHMKAEAIRRDVDLLLVDSGDLHDGTGLSDGYPAGGVNSHDANKIFRQLPYDVLAIGNHELYNYTITYDMYKNFAPKFKGRYLSSNANITIVNERGEAVSVPVGSRYAKFKTRKGRSVTSLGVLFDFKANDYNTTVQRVADMVKEAWFSEAIEEEPDLFLLAGHMPVSGNNWPLVFNAIRKVHPLTPIIILGGHTHIRDCMQLDGRSMSLASGRYMETVGWLTAKLDPKGNSRYIKFTRRYLDANRVTYKYHTGRDKYDFLTLRGKYIKRGLHILAKRFDLFFQYGTAPRDYTINQAPYPSKNSLLSLYIKDAAPMALATNNTRASVPNLIIINSGLQRFDVYSGPFTKNDLFSASPFADHFYYIAEVPLLVAKMVLSSLNDPGSEIRKRHSPLEIQEWEDSVGYVDRRYMNWLEEMNRKDEHKKRDVDQSQTLGYVTHDSCPDSGDDTSHAPLPFHRVPEYIASRPPVLPEDTPIDLVFIDFVALKVLRALNSVQTTTTYSAASVGIYSHVLANQALGIYAQTAWN